MSIYCLFLVDTHELIAFKESKSRIYIFTVLNKNFATGSKNVNLNIELKKLVKCLRINLQKLY